MTSTTPNDTIGEGPFVMWINCGRRPTGKRESYTCSQREVTKSTRRDPRGPQMKKQGWEVEGRVGVRG